MADFVAGDTNSKLKTTLKDNDAGTVIDLTGSTVRLKYRIAGGTLQTKTMTIVAPATGGVTEYLFLAGELTAGRMVAEVEVTTSGGLVMTSLEQLGFEIRAKT